MDGIETTEITDPIYMYRVPMFMLTVSVVLVAENGVILVNEDGKYKIPHGIVRAAQETIQFAAVRHVKEQIGIVLKKDSLIPVDFRSDPERSKSGNIVDIGFVCMVDKDEEIKNGKWVEVDFENKCLNKKKEMYMDQDILLARAIEYVLVMKE